LHKEEAKEKTQPRAIKKEESKETPSLSPAPRRIVEEEGIDPTTIKGTGKDGRITKGDLLSSLEEKPNESEGAQEVKRIRMTEIRKTIARRLVLAKSEAAHLTTFNEVNMEAVLDVRKKYGEEFAQKYSIKLGFMSFFVKAAIAALKEFPLVNGRIEGDEIVLPDFYDIGIAVSTERGLLVPVIRNADSLSFAEIEAKVADLAVRARDKKLTLDELQGGTFTITNGGIFGSLLSTPIPNHPQSAILGMHAIQKRPIVVEGDRIVAKPMMYLALTYDHRLIDGREAVLFLVRIKEHIEDPEKLLLEV